MIKGLGLSVPPLNLQSAKRGWRVNPSPMANDLISCAYVMKHPQNRKKVKFAESFWVGEHEEIWGQWQREGHGSPTHFPCAYAFLPSSWTWVIPFYNHLVNLVSKMFLWVLHHSSKLMVQEAGGECGGGQEVFIELWSTACGSWIEMIA